jgi:hypothetical protein
MEAPHTQLVNQAAAAPFSPDLLEADPPLWGSFWQGDVIAPGYRLPVVELALLRAIRLDCHWPEDTSIDQFLADLRAVIRHPQAGIWSLWLADVRCFIFVAPLDLQPLTFNWPIFNLLTVTWYCPATGCLHTGYRAPLPSLRLNQACPVRLPNWANPPAPTSETTPEWLSEAVAHDDSFGSLRSSVSGWLDTAILRFRLAG